MQQPHARPMLAVVGLTAAALLAIFVSVSGLRDRGPTIGSETAAEAAVAQDPGELEEGALAEGVQIADAQAASVQLAQGDHVVSVGNTLVTQTFELEAGWNAIYLEVEPVNGSRMITRALQAGEPTPEAGDNAYASHELSTMEWVFREVMDEVESVWTWNTRGTTMDFIVHPGEGLWDAAGWVKYFPEGSVGPDGESRAFLTDLVTLHAHRGYLVHVDDSAPDSVLLKVVGVPQVGRPPRGTGEYNLFGFPIHPVAAPDLATFVDPLPIDEVHALQADGTWGELWNRTSGYAGSAVNLRYGEAYLVRVPDEAESDTLFTRNALLDVDTGVGERLEFGAGSSRRGAGGVRTHVVPVRNRSDVTATLTLRAITGTPSVALFFEVDDIHQNDVDLSAVSSHVIEIGGGETRELELNVRSAEQDGDGEALLEVASADLGTRWLIPVSAFSGDHRGLWIGDITVNQVSEGRLGSTNLEAEDGELPVVTFGLQPRNESGIRGAVTLAERAAPGDVSLDVSITLELPDAPAQPIPEPETVTAPVLSGYLFEDRRANGEKDVGDPGFDNLVVELVNGGTRITTPTRSDGSWLVDATDGLTAGTWSLSIIDDGIPGALFEYTRTFDVELPATEVEAEDASAPPVELRANRWPIEVEIGGDLEVQSVTFEDHTEATTVIHRTEFITDSVTRDPIPPPLDFAYAQLFLATLFEGSCTNRDTPIARFEQVPVVKGSLVLTDTEGIENASLNEGLVHGGPPPGVEVLADDHVLYLERRGGANQDENAVACGELTVGQPTIVDGRGSEFELRVLLRVQDQAGTLAVDLLPHFEMDPGNEDALRITATGFAMTRAERHTSTTAATLADAASDGEALAFDVQIDHRHSLNPFKHKYHPDHDNLDAKFNPIDLAAVPPQPYQREVYQYRRQLELELVDSVADIAALAEGLSEDQLEDLDRELDWKGKTWGGLYTEVIKGLHKHDVTVKGYFIIRHVVAGELETQSYD